MADGAGNGPAEQATAAGAPFATAVRHAVVDSTNRVAADAARAGAPHGLVVVADEQTAGRGRLGRRWLAPAGSALLCSALFRSSLATPQLHLLTTLVALAGRDACRDAGVDCQLKWPNDLLAGGRKIAGVLAEVVGPPGPPTAVVVGIGLNVSWPHSALSAATSPQTSAVAALATSLRQEGAEGAERDAVLASLLSHLRRRLPALEDAAGRRGLLEEQRAACSTIGRQVRVELPGGSLTGTATAIDDGGRLLVETGGGTRAVDAGDIVHLRTD